MTPKIICTLLFLFLIGSTSVFSQAKKTVAKKTTTQSATSKPAAASKSDDEKSPEIEKLENSGIEIPVVDTSAAPNDELTAEIKKMIKITNSMESVVFIMKKMIQTQRSGYASQVPAEFYNRFEAQMDNGRMLRLMENMIVKIYRERFSVEEMKQLTAFYSTPLGKKIGAELPAITAQSSAEGEKLGKMIALQIVNDMMKDGSWK